MAVGLGADLIGFICAPSEREVTPGFIRTLKDLPVLKAAVVVHAAAEDPRYAAAVELLEQGYIDVIQLHGDESPQRCSELTHPYYKALRVRSADDVARITEYRCPRTSSMPIILTSMAAPGGLSIRSSSCRLQGSRDSG